MFGNYLSFYNFPFQFFDSFQNQTTFTFVIFKNIKELVVFTNNQKSYKRLFDQFLDFFLKGAIIASQIFENYVVIYNQEFDFCENPDYISLKSFIISHNGFPMDDATVRTSGFFSQFFFSKKSLKIFENFLLV